MIINKLRIHELSEESSLMRLTEIWSIKQSPIVFVVECKSRAGDTYQNVPSRASACRKIMALELKAIRILLFRQSLPYTQVGKVHITRYRKLMADWRCVAPLLL